MAQKIEYFIEKSKNGFALWAKKDNEYYGVGALICNTLLCENQWIFLGMDRAVRYNNPQNELESSLVRVKTLQEVVNCVEEILGGRK